MTGSVEIEKDVYEPYFHDCEKDRDGEHPNYHGSVAPVVVIAPFRRPSGPPSYFEQVRNLHTMSQSHFPPSNTHHRLKLT